MLLFAGIKTAHMFESESFLQLKFARKTFATRPISFWSKMVPSIQVESNVLTVDGVETIQRQKIASLVGHVFHS